MSIFQRIRDVAFKSDLELLPHVHVLDLAKTGFVQCIFCIKLSTLTCNSDEYQISLHISESKSRSQVVRIYKHELGLVDIYSGLELLL